MNEVLKNILETQMVLDVNDQPVPLNSAIDEDEASFLSRLITESKSLNTLEIGCAMGTSSLAICEALKNNGSGNHLIVDPNQSSDWKNIGVNNLRRAGFQNFTLFEEPSEYLLPKLAANGTVLDFAFIDGWHTFDHTLIDFFYINKMLKTGGLVVIDDVGMDSINKVVRFIANYPCYQLVDCVEISISKRKDIFLRLTKPFYYFTKFFPAKIRQNLFSAELIRTDRQLKINSSMVALKKTSKDERPWNWHEKF